MFWSAMFQDGPEYVARIKKGTYRPPDVSIKRLHDAVPKKLREKSTLMSLGYVCRHLGCTYAIYRLGMLIDMIVPALKGSHGCNILVVYFLRPILWFVYWGWQGIVFAGLWCLGHEAGHHALSPYKSVNTAIGLLVHTFVLTPYYSWRVTHSTHHKATNNLERDETYVPPLHEDMMTHDGTGQRMSDFHVFEETPLGTLIKLFVRQFFGFQLYLLHNRKGNPRYLPGTSHYIPSSKLFKPRHYNSIIASNICIASMIALLALYGSRLGWRALCMHYLLPWLWAHNWIVLFTYLQHSDPTIPYYRKDQWTFARGALATVDRPLFGWAGRFFLHNISTDHVAHHFFPEVPFYNLPEVTRSIRPVLGDQYTYDSTPALYALWRSFTQCIYVAPDTNVDVQDTDINNGNVENMPSDNVLFFRNTHGKAVVCATMS